MKKILKYLSLLVLLVLLAGCSPATSPPDTVIGVDIQGIHNQIPLQRHYRDSEKTGQILNLLRLLKFKGDTILDPYSLPGDDYTITLLFTHSPPKTYQIQGGRFLLRPGGNWEKVDSTLAARLPILLEALPTDL